VTATRWPDRPFRWLWTGTAGSFLAAEIGELAMPLFALLVLGASPEGLAAIRVAQFAPFLLLTLALGVVADRMRRRPLLIGADLGRGLVLFAVVTLGALHLLPLPALVAAAAVIGTLTVLSTLADFSFLPAVVPREHLVSANARITATQSLASIAGTGAGGAVVQLLTAPAALLANGSAYLVSAFCLSRVRADEEQPAARAERSRPWTEAREGLRFLLRSRVLRDLAAEAGTWNLFNEILMLGLLVQVMTMSAQGPLLLGLLLMAIAMGAFVGAAVSRQATAAFGYGPSIVAALLIGNTAPLALTVLGAVDGPAAFIVASVALAISGFGGGVANQAVTVRQLATPPGLRGRVNAAYRFLTWGMLAVGAGAAGALVSAGGAALAILVGASGMALATLWVAFSPVRRLRTLEEP
jgi:MFS family permease